MKSKEAQAELQAQVLSSLVTEKLATKDDMTRLEMRLENLIKKEVSDLSNETKQEFIRIAGKFTQLNWMTSFLLAGVMTILFKLFLHS
jgi:hypothetical protein